MAVEVGLEAHAVEVRAGIVLPDLRIDGDRQLAERRGDDLGGLDGPGEVAGDQHVGRDLAGAGQPLGQGLGLLAAQRGQPAAGPMAADHPGHGRVGLTVADEHQPGHGDQSGIPAAVAPATATKMAA